MQSEFYAAKQPDNEVHLSADGSENTALNQEIPSEQAVSAETPTQEVDWEALAKDFEHRWKTNEGMIKKADKDKRAFTAQIEELRAKEQEWQKKFEELESKLTTKQLMAPIEQDEEITFTPEEEEVYGSSKSFIQKMARLEAKQLFQKYAEPLTKEISELRATNKNLATSFANTDENTFRTVIKLNVPDHDEIAYDNDFQDFLDRKLGPYVKASTRDALNLACRERDLQTVVQIFNDFKQSKKQASNGLASMAAPVMNGVGSNTVRSPKKFPKSEFLKARKDFEFGKMRQEQFLEIRKKYDAALAANLVDENA